MNNDLRKRITIGFGILMALAMGATVVLPLFGQGIGQSLVSSNPNAGSNADANRAIPTFPPPVVDFENFTVANTYRHPTGLFSVGQPEGWQVLQPIAGANNAAISMSNSENLSVIQASVQTAGQPITTVEEMDAFYDEVALASSWSTYNDWDEIGRRSEDGRLIIDFRLETRGQTFIARQISWPEDGWLNSVRVVAPENAAELLRFLIQEIAPTMRANGVFAGSPTGWQAYIDEENSHAIRYPSGWVVTDSAPGRPASINAGDEVALRVEAEQAGVIDSADAARAWLESARGGVNVLSVEPVSRGAAAGFAVAYSFTDVDGEAHSALAVLLNGADEMLHVADLNFFGQAVDLNSEEGRERFSNLADVMNTFTVLPSE